MSDVGGLDAHLALTIGDRSISARITAQPGEVIAIIGPNGAGKTTLLRALCGLHPIDAGRVELNGRLLDDPSVLTHVAPEHRSIGVVFQDHLLFDHMSVLDNVAFSLRAAGSSRSESRAEASLLLGRLGLGAFGSRRPPSLSGGEAQQVAIARALIGQPAMLLLDEPLSALDPTTGATRRADLRTFLSMMVGPTLLVTHDLIDAASLATRVMVLEEGRVTSDSPTAEALTRPTTEFAARFCGVTLLRGVAADGVLVTPDGGRIRVDDLTRRGPSIAVIRPGSLRLERADGPTRADAWTGTVGSVEHRGATIMVHVIGRPPVEVELTLADYSATRPTAGDPVYVEVVGAGLPIYADPSAA